MNKTAAHALALAGGLAFAMSSLGAAAEGVYAGVSLGQADVSDFCDDLSGVSCDDTPFTGRIYAGGFFDTYLAFEGGYRYVDKATVEATVAGFGSASIDSSYHMFDGSVVAFTPAVGPMRLFLKVGAQVWRQELDVSLSTVALSGSASESENGVSLRTGVGARFDLTDRFSIRVEYDYLQDVGDDFGLGAQNLESDMHIFSAGPEIRF